MTRRAPGFSLIEMAFVLIIVTLLLGGLLVPFATQVEQKRIAETNKAMEEIKEALIGYALSHRSTPDPLISPTPPIQPYLPCPDTNGDGAEEARTAAGDCPAQEGQLPWVTLGTTPSDAWGNRFHYRVARRFANDQTGFGLSLTGADITICNIAPTGTPGTPPICPIANRVATTIPAVILSYGKNGYGALNANTPAVPPAPSLAKNDSSLASADERTNITQTETFFVSRTITPAGTPATEFDDLVVWLSPNVLFNRMVAAGQLP